MWKTFRRLSPTIFSVYLFGGFSASVESFKRKDRKDSSSVELEKPLCTVGKFSQTVF